MTTTRLTGPGSATLAGAVADDPHVDRAVELSSAMARAILRDPALLEVIPDGCVLILLPAGEPDFVERRLELGMAVVRQGQNVYFKHVPAGFGKEVNDQG